MSDSRAKLDEKKAADEKEQNARDAEQLRFANANARAAQAFKRGGALSQWERLDAVDSKAPPKVDAVGGLNSPKQITEFLDPGTYKRNDVKLHIGEKNHVSADYAVTDSQYRAQFREAYDLLAMEGGGCDTMKPIIGDDSPFTRERLNIHFELAAERNLMLDLSDKNMQKFLNRLPEKDQKMYRDAQEQLKQNFEKRTILTDLAQGATHELNAKDVDKEQKFLTTSMRNELDEKIAALSAPADDKKIKELQDQKEALQKNANDFQKKLMTGTSAEQAKTLSNELDESKKRLGQVKRSLEQVEQVQNSVKTLLQDGAASKVGQTNNVVLPTSGVGTRIVSALTGGLQAATTGSIKTSMSEQEVLEQAKMSNTYNIAAEKALFKAIRSELETLAARKDEMTIQRNNIQTEASKLPAGDDKNNLETKLKSIDESMKELNEQQAKVAEVHEKVYQNGKSLSVGIDEQLQEKIDKDKSAAPRMGSGGST